MSKRRYSGPMSEDLELVITGGPPRYTSRTDKSVEHATLADNQGVVAGYFYVNDQDGAAGWVPSATATPEQQNLAAPWSRLLHSGKACGLKPSAALAELLATSNPRSHFVPGSRRVSANLASLRELAGGRRGDVS